MAALADSGMSFAINVTKQKNRNHMNTQENKQKVNDLVRSVATTSLPGDTLSGFDDWDKGHVETIARRHGIILLNKLQAQLFAMTVAPDSRTAMSLMGASFSTRSGDEQTDVRLTHIDPNNYDSSEAGYFTALHELGHQILKHGQEEPEKIIQNEIEAWEWAVAHANRFPSDDTICFMLDNLSTYTDPNHTFNAETRRATEEWIMEGIKDKQ